MILQCFLLFSCLFSCIAPSQSAFVWNTTPWSTCDFACSHSRTVTCIDDSTNTIVSSSLCDSTTKPASLGTCTDGSCIYFWTPSSWSSCDGNCNQTRTVSCKTYNNIPLNNSDCQLKNGPYTEALWQTCYLSTARWYTSIYQGCNQYCNQTRDVYCTDNGFGFLPDCHCLQKESRPSNQQFCVGGMCTVSWYASSWDTCSISCNQTRNVSCYTNTNVRVSDTYCNALTKPSSSQVCTGGSCISDWMITSDWSSCNSTCTQTRTVTCVTSTNRTVSDVYCNSTLLPPRSQACNSSPCVLYEWKIPSWSTCSYYCNQTRNVTCFSNYSPYQMVINDSYCVMSLNMTKPVTTQMCIASGSCQYWWDYGYLGSCTVDCYQLRYGVKCMWNRGWGIFQQVSDSFCSHMQMPALVQVCNKDACVPYIWMTNNTLSTCSRFCNQTREPYCYSKLTSSYTDESNCNATTKSKYTLTQLCLGGFCQGLWSSSSWTSCDIYCKQYRYVACINGTSFTSTYHVDESNCSYQPKPSVEQMCSGGSCKPYAWLAGNWSLCNTNNCLQTRNVSCVDVYNQTIVNDTICVQLWTWPYGKPISTQACCSSSSSSSSTISSSSLSSSSSTGVTPSSSSSSGSSTGVTPSSSSSSSSSGSSTGVTRVSSSSTSSSSSSSTGVMHVSSSSSTSSSSTGITRVSSSSSSSSSSSGSNNSSGIVNGPSGSNQFDTVSNSSTTGGIIAGVVVSVIVVIGLSVGFWWYKYRRVDNTRHVEMVEPSSL